MEYTKVNLKKAIHSLTNYTYNEIEEVYQKAFTKYPKQAKYYANKRAIGVLMGWLNTLQHKNKKDV